MRIEKEVIGWKGFGNGFGEWESKCLIRIYEHQQKQVVIATELPDNTGTSITNCVENLAAIVIETFGLDFRRMIWIEHYPKPSGEDTFDFVSFKVSLTPSKIAGGASIAELVSPQWKRLKRAHVESLIGEALD